jgi:hypothetical protein
MLGAGTLLRPASGGVDRPESGETNQPGSHGAKETTPVFRCR